MKVFLLLVVLGLDHSGSLVTSTQKGGDLESTVASQPSSADSGVDRPETAAPESVSETAICPCLGYRGRAHCYCLQRGVACKCNRTTGSEWNMENGRPVQKTGRYANPNQTVAANRNAAPFSPAAGSTPRPPGADSGFEVTLRNDGRWYWNDGVRWRYSPSAPVEGTRYSDSAAAFVYRGGRMQPASKMAAVIQPAGHWERRCVGGVCRMYWIAH